MIRPRIPFSSISLGSLRTMGERISNIIDTRHPDEPTFARAMSRLLDCIAMAIRALGSSRALEGTPLVADADHDRDNSYDSLRNHIRSGLKRNNEAYRNACERLFPIFEKNGLGLSSLPYAEQTSALKSLFEDLTGTQAVADLATVHATEWLQELKDDQGIFEEALEARGEEQAGEDTPTDKEAERTLTDAHKSLFKTLDVAEENEMVENVAETNDLVNVVIDETVRAV